MTVEIIQLWGCAGILYLMMFRDESLALIYDALNAYVLFAPALVGAVLALKEILQ